MRSDHPQQGLHLAAAAARSAGIALTLFGAIEDPDYWQAQVRPLLGAGIAYGGHLDGEALAAELGRASLFVFTPCWDEPFGLVAAEAMACGLPVAAFDRGAQGRGRSRRLRCSSDVAGLADAMRAACAIPRHVARDRVTRRFTRDRLARPLRGTAARSPARPRRSRHERRRGGAAGHARPPVPRPRRPWRSLCAARLSRSSQRRGQRDLARRGGDAAPRVTGRDPCYTSTWHDFDKKAAFRRACPDGPVFLHGGGNLGDIWPHHQRFRERIVAALHDRRIVQLPQSIHFDNADEAHRFANRAARHDDLTLYVRDRPSLAIARGLVGLADRARLAPNSAFALGPQPRGLATTETLALMRSDGERREHDARLLTGAAVVDWLRRSGRAGREDRRRGTGAAGDGSPASRPRPVVDRSHDRHRSPARSYPGAAARHPARRARQSLRQGRRLYRRMDARVAAASTPRPRPGGVSDAIDVSLLVCTRNRAASLARLLASVSEALVAAGDVAVEIVIVDNGSSDDTVARVADWRAAQMVRVRLLHEPRPGLAVARDRRHRHRAWRHRRDDRRRLSTAPISRRWRRASRTDVPVIIGGRIRHGDPADLPVTIKVEDHPMTAPPGNSPGGFVMGANLAFTATVAARTGPFDERFGPGRPLRRRRTPTSSSARWDWAFRSATTHASRSITSTGGARRRRRRGCSPATASATVRSTQASVPRPPHPALPVARRRGLGARPVRSGDDPPRDPPLLPLPGCATSCAGWSPMPGSR
ncbi:polysaccharide pyruvyl transferase family protein [Sphingomonas sp. MMS24-JH45]